MAMVVNKNLNAMNAHRYLGLSESNFNKSVERLSSGLRINRAADDPAGLVLSEKYRAQVEGLHQAIKNAQDGISLVQTAEGALDEIGGLLRTMRNLALHAANTGANDTAAIAADQAQITKSIETLNRIANTTSFGTKKLLNGQAGVTATTTNSNVTFVSGTTATQAGTYTPINITQAAVQGVHTSKAARVTAQAIGAQAGTAGDQTFTAVNNGIFSVTDGTNTVTITLNETSGTLGGGVVSKQWMVDQLNAGFADEGMNALASISGNRIVITGTHLSAGNLLTVDARGANAATQTLVQNLTAFTSSDAIGTASATASTGINASLSAKLGTAETLTFRATATSTAVNVVLTADSTIQNALDSINSALQQNNIKAVASYSETDGAFVLTNSEYGGTGTATIQVTSNAAGAATNTNLVTTANTYEFIATGAGVAGVAGLDVAGTIGGLAATGSGQMLTGAQGTNVEGLTLKIAGGVTGDQGSVTVTQSSLDFQIGAFANETVMLQLGDVRATNLGTTATGITFMSSVSVSDIDVTAGNGKGAQDAIKVLDAAIAQVSSMRSEMGSFQKDVLEASVRNLGVAAQNMASTESVIRDADMAAEMLNFSRAQILQQTGMAMLAQANQAPQQIMRLFS